MLCLHIIIVSCLESYIQISYIMYIVSQCNFYWDWDCSVNYIIADKLNRITQT